MDDAEGGGRGDGAGDGLGRGGRGDGFGAVFGEVGGRDPALKGAVELFGEPPACVDD